MEEVNFDPRLRMPFSCLVAGPSGSGKTYFIYQILRNIEHTLSKVPSKIIFSYSSYQKNYDTIKKDLAARHIDIKFIEGLPDSFTDEGLFPPNQHNLLVVDDSMLMGSNSEELAKTFIEYRHHRNLSVFFLVQNLFHQGKFSRVISLNSNYMILFKNPRDRLQIKFMANQMYPTNKLFFLQSYEDATRNPHGYLLVDLTANCPDAFRLRSGLMPDEWPVIYLPRKK